MELAPDPQKQKTSKEELRSLNSMVNNVWFVHYSCESFYDRPSGLSPRITSIALKNLASGQCRSFSIHQAAEKNGVASSQITKQYKRLEKIMLGEYFKHLSAHTGAHYVHWNMRDIEYGFIALEHRFAVLKGKPFVVPDSQKHDLSRVLVDIYGENYIMPPHMKNVVQKNNITDRDFMDGKSEAEAFTGGNYVALHRSTLRKVEMFATIFDKTSRSALQTNTTWWQMHGGNLRTFVDYIVANKLLAFTIAVAGLGLAIWSFMA